MALLEFEASNWQEYLAGGGTRGLQRALASDPEAVIAEIMKSGLRGRGGAGFPTAIKMGAIRRNGDGKRYVVCNFSEGEPATFKDRLLTRANPYLMVEGLAISAHALGADTAIICIKEAHEREIALTRQALDDFNASGAFGDIQVLLTTGPDQYLLGEETGLLEAIEGKPTMPRVPRPFEIGLWAKYPEQNPTLVDNVETLANITMILAEGADWIRQWGTERSPGTMLMTIAGDVAYEGCFEIELGTPMRVLLEDKAQGMRDGGTLRVIVPGASSPVIPPELLDTPLDFDSMRTVGSGLGSASFAVWDTTRCVVQLAEMYSRFLWVESCGQCMSCKIGLGDATSGLRRLLDEKGGGADVDYVIERARHGVDANRCALPMGEVNLVQSFIRCFPEFWPHQNCPGHTDIPFPKVKDWDAEAGRFTYDEKVMRKTPDWHYADEPWRPADMRPARKRLRDAFVGTN